MERERERGFSFLLCSLGGWVARPRLRVTAGVCVVVRRVVQREEGGPQRPPCLFYTRRGVSAQDLVFGTPLGAVDRAFKEARGTPLSAAAAAAGDKLVASGVEVVKLALLVLEARGKGAPSHIVLVPVPDHTPGESRYLAVVNKVAAALNAAPGGPPASVAAHLLQRACPAPHAAQRGPLSNEADAEAKVCA